MVRYKEALSHVAPNMEQDDPVRAVWVLRKNPAPYEPSKLGSRHSSMSHSPSKQLSIRSLNQSPNQQFQAKENHKMVPPIKKLVPGEASPR